MLDALTGWIGALFVAVFKAAWDFVVDVVIWLVDSFLTALAALIAAVPLPDFVNGGMTALLGGLGSDIRFILVNAGLVSALALIGSGFAFRLGRKLLTLFQW